MSGASWVNWTLGPSLLLVFLAAGCWERKVTPPVSLRSPPPAVAPRPVVPSSIVDSLHPGDAASESRHGLRSSGSEVYHGGLGEAARRLMPLSATNWEGGALSFAMRVDPAATNYLTARFWGSEADVNRMMLYCEGKQIGYRHLGDIDVLSEGSEDPPCAGRFFYNTTPLPYSLTQGRTNLQCEIRSMGRIWGYGTSFEQYQKPMEGSTRGLYGIYTHTDGFFTPPEGDTQGGAPASPAVRRTPGPEVLDALKAQVNGEIDRRLKDARPMNQMQLQFLARAYHEKWTRASGNPAAVERVAQGLDALFVSYRKNPSLAESEPSSWNPGWFGLGPAGDAVRLLAEPLKPLLDAQVADASGKKLPRRAAWSEMLVASRDWHRQHRRLYTNQSMINDLNIYAANRGVAVLDPPKALPEKEVLRYLYESVGLAPWLGSDTDHGPDRSAGDNYRQLTAKGLTRELGYVGYYGEVLDWVSQIYDLTRPAPGEPGDAAIRAQLEKVALARAAFRYPALDREGNRAMRIEAVVGWRDNGHYPGDVAYAQRFTWDGSPVQAAAATLSPRLTGFAQQMFDDNQFFDMVSRQMKGASFRVVVNLLGVPGDYETILAQSPSVYRLPMTAGAQDCDFARTDEEDGVIAIRHGEEILYVSLYWRARHAVNFLARVHHITPQLERIAVVREETVYEPSGMTYKRPDWTNFGFGNGGPRYPGEFHSAHAGEELPIAKIPAGIQFKAGNESPYAGKGLFYRLQYGPYLIGMNCATNQAYNLRVPPTLTKARELVSGKTLAIAGAARVEPLSTVVLVAE
jgi:hypothetical protein